MYAEGKRGSRVERGVHKRVGSITDGLARRDKLEGSTAAGREPAEAALTPESRKSLPRRYTAAAEPARSGSYAALALTLRTCEV